MQFQANMLNSIYMYSFAILFHAFTENRKQPAGVLVKVGRRSENLTKIR